ncbi:hypothetical protein SAMD00019534_020590, partial [Acytostelium subglobosum LB1]
SSSSQMVTD